MKLARLNSTVLVNPEEVASVTLPERGEFVCVAMRSGEVHRIEAGYGEGRYAAMDRIVKALQTERE